MGVFAVCYALFVLLPNRRSWVACAGGLLLLFSGVLPWQNALTEKINWNVIGLFWGTLVLADLFLKSRAPDVLAGWVMSRMPSVRMSMLALCALSGFISIFIENVAVVLLVAPIALSLASRLKISPVPMLIGIAICSNLQGTATMVGDPPSMILAGEMKMGFWDFFIFHGRPSIFFAIQVGAILSLLVLFWVFRKFRSAGEGFDRMKIRSMVPTWLLCGLVLGLSFASTIDREFRWFAGSYTLALAVVALVWYRFIAKWGKIGRFVKSLDWDTTFFLIGVFVLVGALGDSGWLEKLAQWMSQSVGGSVLMAYLLLVLVAVAVSSFVDNVPFLLVMIPVVNQLAKTLNAPVAVLMFGLLVGACLGGNITPIGASANVVALGILRRRGYTVGFGDFMRISVPFTIAALAGGTLFVWFFVK